MSVIKPKTIIVSAQPLRTIQPVTGCYRTLVDLGKTLESSLSPSDLESLISDDRMSDDDLSSCGGEVPRKRQRLSFLSPEEKMVRRKLKNRVAAQTARDRKKQRMTELEEALAALQAENQALQAQNDDLRRSTDTLLHENNALKQRLSQHTTSVINNSQPITTVDSSLRSEAVTRKSSDVDLIKSAAGAIGVDGISTDGFLHQSTSSTQFGSWGELQVFEEGSVVEEETSIGADNEWQQTATDWNTVDASCQVQAETTEGMVGQDTDYSSSSLLDEQYTKVPVDMIQSDHMYYKLLPDNMQYSSSSSGDEIETIVVECDDVDSVIAVSDVDQHSVTDDDQFSSLSSPSTASSDDGILPDDVLDLTTLTDLELLELTHNLQQLIDNNVESHSTPSTLPPSPHITIHSTSDLDHTISPFDDPYSSVEPWNSPLPVTKSTICSSGIEHPSDLLCDTDYSFQWEESFTQLFPTLV